MSDPGAPLMSPASSDEVVDDQATGDAAQEVDPDEPVVLCTIMLNPADGTYTFISGDEGDAGAEDGMSGEDAEGMPPAAGGVAPQPAGKTFDAPGPLLKEVLDMLKAAEERSGGSAEAGFDEGFNGPKEPKQKY